MFNPSNEIGASVPFRLVLAHTDAVALWMTNVRVFTGGMTFSLDACQRDGDKHLDMGGFGRPVSHATPPLLFGIEDSAGTIATNLPRTRSGLQLEGGGSSDGNNSARFSLSPLPARGAMGVYVAWPHFGIEETRFDVDTTAIHDAVADVIALWPGEERKPLLVDMDDYSIPDLEIPADGWFARQNPPPRPPRQPADPNRINFGYVGDTGQAL